MPEQGINVLKDHSKTQNFAPDQSSPQSEPQGVGGGELGGRNGDVKQSLRWEVEPAEIAMTGWESAPSTSTGLPK